MEKQENRDHDAVARRILQPIGFDFKEEDDFEPFDRVTGRLFDARDVLIFLLGIREASDNIFQTLQDKTSGVRTTSEEKDEFILFRENEQDLMSLARWKGGFSRDEEGQEIFIGFQVPHTHRFKKSSVVAVVYEVGVGESLQIRRVQIQTREGTIVIRDDGIIQETHGEIEGAV